MAQALQRTDMTGKITWLGRVPHRDRPEITCIPLTEMPLGFAGAEGEVHAGLTRLSCIRVAQQYSRDTEIRNTRQVSLVAQEDIDAIAADMGIAALDPGWLGASVVISGLPDFTHLPPSSRLQFADGTTLTVDMLNKPCKFPARSIAIVHPAESRLFKSAAEGRRGITAWVERPGTLRLGQSVRLHIPAQRAWRGSAASAPANETS